MTDTPCVLIPFHRSEALSIAEAARISGRCVRTMREWCHLHDIGRRIGGQWAVSKVALQMHLDGDRAALRAYLAGDRSFPTIVAYFERCDVPLPDRDGAPDHHRETMLSEVNARHESEAM